MKDLRSALWISRTRAPSPYFPTAAGTSVKFKCDLRRLGAGGEDLGPDAFLRAGYVKKKPSLFSGEP